MRHINFDESTVLRELVRIAGEKGLVKEAQPPATMPGPGAAMPSTKIHVFDEQLRAFPILSGLNKGQRVTDGAAFLRELGSNEFRRFRDGWASSADAEGKKKLMALVAKAMPFVKQLQAQLKKMSPQHQEAYLPAVQNAMALLTKASVEEDGTIKQAAEKLYDVSGETGEDLVDAAHPGGGTATELTHSKTKENLVETIVEQQEKDVEVARKAPKGTYAALVNLYNKLSKLGLEDKLVGLKESIAEVATAEEVVEHALITLADDLDRLGYSLQADGVDELLKKK